MHEPIRNEVIQFRNERQWIEIHTRLYNVYLSMFKWTNLPYDENRWYMISQYIERTFAMGGRVAACMTNGTEFDRYASPNFADGSLVFGNAAGYGGRNWYDEYEQYSITTALGSILRDRKDMALVKTNPLAWPIINMIDYYADMLYHIERATLVNLKGQNTPLIMEVQQGQELTAANTYEQIAGYKPVVYGYKGLRVEDRNTYQYFPPAPYICDNLYELRRKTIAEFYTRIGVAAQIEAKRERLVAAEVSANDAMITKNLDQELYVRKDLADQINNLWGLSVEVDYDVSGAALATAKAQLESSGEALLTLHEEHNGDVDETIDSMSEELGRVEDDVSTGV